MKGLRFYLEYDSPAQKRKGTVKNPGKHSGNCVAVILDNNNKDSYFISSQGTIQVEALCAVFPFSDSDICCSSVDAQYLREYCRRIPESLAREIHPAMFRYIAMCD